MTTSCALTEHELLYDTLGHKLYLALTPFIICIGLIGNILTVCVFILTDLKRQSVSIITIALAIADSFVLLIPVSILWLEKILKRELTDLSPFWCRTHGFFDLTFTSCSSWLMVCIAFERFCAVWLPHNNKKIFTHRKTFILVLIIVFLSTILSTWFIFVVKTTRTSIISLKNHTENILLTSDNRTTNQHWKCNLVDDSLYDSMGMFSVIINYILPFMFVLLLNSTVIYRLCQRGIVELTSSITVMLTLVCLVHLFCTLPFQCWWIYYEIPDQTGDCIWLKKKLTWRTITFTIRNINYMANFFLYSCSSKLFRNELKSLIFLSLLPHEKYQNYHYRRQSLYDNMQQQRISLTHLVMRRLSRTTDFTNVGIFHSGTNVTPANNPNGNI
ncbi:unnamed protein product [Rotaria sp. Silwood1]|nr:unnamed protein product [Rotaria sp. Silwood1]CAF0887390.1 unnamed protein product [Rotaria sp. Silwood1]CAF0901285.1 unnamed protein product [Rotaria sp. Silwood1]CAF3349932.1 unnamed protein product [Rotaria sp. Silwood1]CAF3372996.1 unnamed protein product [Rotaria sp. Silwood1]